MNVPAFGETFVDPNEPSAPAERVLRNVLVVLHERGLKKQYDVKYHTGRHVSLRTCLGSGSFSDHFGLFQPDHQLDDSARGATAEPRALRPRAPPVVLRAGVLRSMFQLLPSKLPESSDHGNSMHGANKRTDDKRFQHHPHHHCDGAGPLFRHMLPAPLWPSLFHTVAVAHRDLYMGTRVDYSPHLVPQHKK